MASRASDRLVSALNTELAPLVSRVARQTGYTEENVIRALELWARLQLDRTGTRPRRRTKK